MLGVPTYWRTLDRDTVNDPALHEVILKADIVSPWTVGRYGDIPQADELCREDAGTPISPGARSTARSICRWFSRVQLAQHVSEDSAEPDSPAGRQIPLGAVRGGEKGRCTMVYQAMFDEMDEGTAIYKCTQRSAGGRVEVRHLRRSSQRSLSETGRRGDADDSRKAAGCRSVAAGAGEVASARRNRSQACGVASPSAAKDSGVEMRCCRDPSLRGCEKMGTGTSLDAFSTGFALPGSEPVPIFSQLLRLG